jgi:5-methylcytosine-specific restriction endonuclease McrA
MTLNSYQALKLDAAYRPIAIIPATEALVSHMLGKTYVLETHDRIIRSASEAHALPAVVVLKSRVVKKLRTFACSTKNLRIRDDGECQYCGTEIQPGKETVDHVKPKCKGGKHEWTNIVLSCVCCNQKKGAKTVAEAGLRLKKPPIELDYFTYLKKMCGELEKWKIYLKG